MASLNSIFPMKKILSFLLISFLIVNSVIAQNETRKSILMLSAKALEQESRSSFSDAVIKAKEKGWPLTYKSKGNATSTLVGIDSFGQPIYYTTYVDPIDAITTGTNQLWTGGSLGLNLSASTDVMTNRIGVWDEGAPLKTHVELSGKVTVNDNTTKSVDHSTHVAGIIASRGVNPLAKGMSYGIKGFYAYDWNNDASEMSAAAANGLLISNHSYGTVCGWDYNSDSSRWEFNGKWNEKEDYKFGLYENTAQVFDSIAYNAPNYLIVKSAGNNRSSTGPAVGSPYWRRDQNNKWYNAGNRPDTLSSNNSYGIIPTDANAKNILTVGAVGGISAGYLKKEDVVMSSFSSWGPTDDGRIKPDIVTDGVSVYSTMSTNDSAYAYLNGTSMASPGAAGSLLLLQELSNQLSAKFLRSATIKGLAIHTANEAGLYPGPDYKFGWGLLNMSEAAAAEKNALTNKNSSTSNDLIYEDVLNNGKTNTYTVIASGSKPLKATIVWTDIKGGVSSTLNDSSRKLVSDLDLLIKKDTINYYPWVLNPSAPDLAASKGINIIDNVEKVEIDTTLIGKTYTISVSHKGTLERGQQAYSLIVSGVGGAAYCSSVPSSSAGTKIDTAILNNIQFVNTGAAQYIDNSNLYVNGEANGLLPISLKLNTTDGSNNSRYVKVFIDYDNNGTFDAAENVLTSAALTNGLYTANISLPSTLTIGKLVKIRIVVMETTAAANVNACGAYSIGETQDYTLKVVNASNDLQIGDIINPTANVCQKDKQYVTVKIINNGSTAQSNIPVSLVVTKAGQTVLSSNEIFNGRLNGLENMNYTFQKPLTVDANSTYTITATVNITNDQQKNNNSLSTTIVTAAAAVAPIGSASNCNSSLKLTVTNPISGNNYLWYDTSLLATPIALGSQINTSSAASKVYLQQGYRGNIAPLKNNSLGTGSYNSFSGNYVKFNTTAPVTIETSKLYTGYPGKIDFILGTFGTNNADGSYTYYPIQTVSLNVGASNPTPAPGATPFSDSDTGRVYNLNLKVPAAGDYIIIVKCDSASLFRNNAAPDLTYPIGPNKIFSFTGNSVAAASGNYQNYFYFFYNTQISTNDCLSPATNLNVTTASKPTITQAGDSLTSSTASQYQWYMNDEMITGATSKVFKPTKNALYKVATFAGDCQNVSDNKLILITDIAEASAKEINLNISSTDYVENMIKGNQFYIQFSNIQTQDISLEIMNSMGSKVFQKENLINQRTPQLVTMNSVTPGIYFVKIYANKKVYVQRVFIDN